MSTNATVCNTLKKENEHKSDTNATPPPRKKTMGRKKVVEPELSEEEKQVALEQVKATQQRFVELLLTGKSIAEAARVLQISRRTATYWMQQDTFVRYAYEHERQCAATAFRERIAKLHDLALTALEEALSDETQPVLRLSAARFIYSSNLAPYGTLAPLADSEHLVDEVLDDAERAVLFGKNNEVRLYKVHDN
jgi:hypothetical protein